MVLGRWTWRPLGHGVSWWAPGYLRSNARSGSISLQGRRRTITDGVITWRRTCSGSTTLRMVRSWESLSCIGAGSVQAQGQKDSGSIACIHSIYSRSERNSMGEINWERGNRQLEFQDLPRAHRAACMERFSCTMPTLCGNMPQSSGGACQ